MDDAPARCLSSPRHPRVHRAHRQSLSSPPYFHGQAADITQLPLWIIVSFGAYLLGTLGWNIFTFQDKEDAYKSLLLDIEEAKRELRKKGVTVD